MEGGGTLRGPSGAVGDILRLIMGVSHTRCHWAQKKKFRGVGEGHDCILGLRNALLVNG